MEFKNRSSIIDAILKKALEDRNRAFGREINQFERHYRKLSGLSPMTSQVYIAARASDEYHVTKLHELLGLDEEIISPIKRIIFKAAKNYFGTPVLLHENIVYKSSSEQLNLDKKELKGEVAKLAKKKIEDLKAETSQIEKLMEQIS